MPNNLNTLNSPTYSEEEIQGLKARALELWRSDQSSAMELGLAVLAVRAALRNRHGAFKKWWQDNKLSQARVSYCMRLASAKLLLPKRRGGQWSEL